MYVCLTKLERRRFSLLSCTLNIPNEEREAEVENIFLNISEPVQTLLQENWR